MNDTLTPGWRARLMRLAGAIALALTLAPALALSAARAAQPPPPGLPLITSTDPRSATAGGGQPITISGLNFVDGDTVWFVSAGGAFRAQARVTRVDRFSGDITARIPPDPDPLATGTPDRFSIHVRPPVAQCTKYQDAYCSDSNVQKNVEILFSYDAQRLPAPTIADIQPKQARPTGGTQLVITGKNFTARSAVFEFPSGPFTVSPPQVQVNAKGDSLNLEAPAPPRSDAGAHLPLSVPVHVQTPSSGVATTKFRLAAGASSSDCAAPPGGNPVESFVNSLFAIPDCAGVSHGFVTWLLQEPDVSGTLRSSLSGTQVPSNVQQLETLSEGIALGLLGLVFTISVLRYTVAGLASGSPGAVVQGIVHPAGAAIMVIAWPQLYRFGAITADTVTVAVARGPVNLNAPVLVAAVFALAGGVGVFLGGVGWVIGISIVLAGLALFFALIALKLTLFALMTVVYVAMPLLIMASRLPSFEWLLKGGLRAWGVGLVWPIGWAVVLACGGAVFGDLGNVGPGGDLVTGAVEKSLVSLILLGACVKMPGMMMRVALHGTGAGGGGRGLGGALLLNQFAGRALAAAGAFAGVPPWLTGIGAKQASALNIGGKAPVAPIAGGESGGSVQIPAALMPGYSSATPTAAASGTPASAIPTPKAAANGTPASAIPTPGPTPKPVQTPNGLMTPDLLTRANDAAGIMHDNRHYGSSANTAYPPDADGAAQAFADLGPGLAQYLYAHRRDVSPQSGKHMLAWNCAVAIAARPEAGKRSPAQEKEVGALYTIGSVPTITAVEQGWDINKSLTKRSVP